MAAFTAEDPQNREVFLTHWAKIMRDDTIVLRTIMVDGEIAGNVVSFVVDGQREVGYWLGRPYWGKGLATQALREFLAVVAERPLYAHVAEDNAASLRVLVKCGFTVVGEGKAYAHGRGGETEELILRLPR
jgi:RimJ/RimL family protein N-acetyltransferase